MSDKFSEGQWVLWECRNGVEIAVRRTTVLADGVTWICGEWRWHAGGRHTVAGIDHPFDLITPICLLTQNPITEQPDRLQQELRKVYEERDRVQRLLEEEREKSARYPGQLHELTVGCAYSEAAFLKVIRILGRREQ